MNEQSLHGRMKATRCSRWALLAVALCSCASQRRPSEWSKSSEVVPHSTPGRVEPPIEGVPKPSSWVLGPGVHLLDDGTRVAVIANRRITFAGARATSIDAQAIDDLGSPYRLPTELGAGTLFVGKHSVRFASSFAGPLIDIVIAPAKSELEVGIGRDCLLVQFEPNHPRLYEIPTGKPLPLSPPGLSEIFGTPRGLVAARVKDALFVSMSRQDPSWRKIPSPPVSMLAYDGKGVVVETSKGTFRLGFDGKLNPKSNETGMTSASNLFAIDEPFPDVEHPAPPPTDEERLVSPFSRIMDNDVAVTIEDNALLFLNAHTGKVIGSDADAFGKRENCFLIRGGHPSFVGCGSAESTDLFRIDSVTSKPVLERSFKGIYTHDFGHPEVDAPLAFDGRCNGERTPLTFCVRRSEKQWEELSLPKTDGNAKVKVPHSIHVTVSREGFPYAFGWVDFADTLVITDGMTRKVRSIDTKTDLEEPLSVDWNSVTIESGSIRFLASEKGRAGATISDILANDRVQVTQLSGTFAASGPKALRATPDGKLFETLDAGKTFREVEPPPAGMPDIHEVPFGCYETGCVAAPWYRVGWGTR